MGTLWNAVDLVWRVLAAAVLEPTWRMSFAKCVRVRVKVMELRLFDSNATGNAVDPFGECSLQLC